MRRMNAYAPALARYAGCYTHARHYGRRWLLIVTPANRILASLRYLRREMKRDAAAVARFRAQRWRHAYFVIA